jgi:protein-tyrosine phosphatase
MAEALFRAKMAGLDMEIKSAGVAAYEGQPATNHALQVLMERGITHEHQARRLDEELIAWADIILTMTLNHKELIHTFFPQAEGKTFTLNEYVGNGARDIGDPFGGGYETYKKCAKEIDEALEKLREKLSVDQEAI